MWSALASSLVAHHPLSPFSLAIHPPSFCRASSSVAFPVSFSWYRATMQEKIPPPIYELPDYDPSAHRDRRSLRAAAVAKIHDAIRG
jgi:hypothetical protein